MTKSIATASINRETAVALIDAALAAARAIGIPAAVAVVDATGNLRAFERTDDAPFLTVDVAIDKAWSSASFECRRRIVEIFYCRFDFFPNRLADEAIVINDVRNRRGRNTRQAGDIFHCGQALPLLT